MTRAHAAELEQLRADAAREREELRARAERAERDLDTTRAELARMRQESGTADTPGASRRRQPPAGE